MWKRLCVPYFKEMGLALGKPGPSEDDRTYVRLLCRRILDATEHGNTRKPEAIQVVAQEIAKGVI